jgi:predicted ATP-grasp superfamily ATP-dependent carboligase
MLRCFAPAGVQTLVVCTSADNLTFRSRHCRQRFIMTDPHRDSDAALADLLALGRSFDSPPVLFYGDDATLRLVSRRRAELAQCYRFLMPDPQRIEELTDKAAFACLAQRLGLPVPRTLLSCDVDSAEQALQSLELPCVLKPNSHIGWFRSQMILEEGGSPQKALRADTFDEFRRLFDKMKSLGIDFIIQEYIHGNDDCIYSFHAYFNAASEPLGYYVGKKIRTYPKGAGLSTYVELVHDPQVVEVGLDVLRKLNFVGVVKIDFKKDPHRNRFYLLEINPRFNLWNHLGATCGVNLPLLAHHDLLGLPVQPQFHWRTGIRWLSFMDDLRAFVRDYRPAGDLTFPQWLASLGSPKVHDIFAWSDPWPFAVALARATKLYADKWLLRRFVPPPSLAKGVAK